MSRDGLRLALIVPARNEAGVVARRLRGLLRAPWPAGARHRLVLVDDGSSDGTAELARELLAASTTPSGLRVEVVTNSGRPGKPGAIEAGLRALRDERGHLPVDLVVLSDADVVLDPGALLALAGAFRADPDLALACGSQHLVAGLAQSGLPEAPGGGPLVSAAGRYDRLTAWVRQLESRHGRLFSVHGQLLAWRARLELAPRSGFAADDLDLVLQLRERPRTNTAPWRTVLVPEARFYEVKTAAGPAAEQQALRRARAYVQVLRASRAPRGDRVACLQWRVYRTVPLFAPEILLVGAALVVLVAALLSPLVAVAALALMALLSAAPVGRHLLRLMRLIRRARRLEARCAQPEHWEMAR